MPSVTTKSPWVRHVERWRDCRACHLCRTRINVVLGKGQVPCDLLFVGEGPGKSEDVRGQPFVGPAGRLLDQIVAEALLPWVTPAGTQPLCLAWTNLTCCIPVNDQGAKEGPPDVTAIKACAPRLAEFVRLADPRLICCVGSLAETQIASGGGKLHQDVPTVSIAHPAAMLRAPFAQQSLLRRRAVVLLRAACEEHLP